MTRYLFFQSGNLRQPGSMVTGEAVDKEYRLAFAFLYIIDIKTASVY